MKHLEIAKQTIQEPVGVLGIGVEGRATLQYLSSLGITAVEALDKNEISGLSPNVKHTFGETYLHNLKRFKTIFRSPGFRPDIEPLIEAKNEGAIITSAISHFIQVCPCKIIAITGTVGKGTAASITAKALEAAGFTVHLGGNIGKSPLAFLPEVEEHHIVVLEISSFQAMDLHDSPQFVGILKTTTEHLDWHTDTTEYRMAKAALLAHQSRDNSVVYNADSEGAKEIVKHSKATQYGYSTTSKVTNGIYLNNNQLVWVKDNQESPLPIELSNVKLAGTFNLENIAAAILLAHLAGGALEPVCKAAQDFVGLSNRLEFVCQKEGIRFFNDSYATRPDAAMAAVSAFKQPLALIMGGSEKNADFSELVEQLHTTPNIVSIALIGQTAPRMQTEINNKGPHSFKITICETLRDALEFSASQLKKEGVVLMAPACASFGMFKNYKERGAQFVTLAKQFCQTD